MLRLNARVGQCLPHCSGGIHPVNGTEPADFDPGRAAVCPSRIVRFQQPESGAFTRYARSILSKGERQFLGQFLYTTGQKRTRAAEAEELGCVMNRVQTRSHSRAD